MVIWCHFKWGKFWLPSISAEIPVGFLELEDEHCRPSARSKVLPLRTLLWHSQRKHQGNRIQDWSDTMWIIIPMDEHKQLSKKLPTSFTEVSKHIPKSRPSALGRRAWGKFGSVWEMWSQNHQKAGLCIGFQAYHYTSCHQLFRVCLGFVWGLFGICLGFV